MTILFERNSWKTTIPPMVGTVQVFIKLPIYLIICHHSAICLITMIMILYNVMPKEPKENV
eukprot:CAMPEP_0172443304 /NCGR_PEP_ID=MMETSP1065-20121228/3599_1 /TAXON_ID=265537 /ORGANISM="Amphiprora paludosa, Strain CCMP125" /LENGTH=60 /DNA_ID=CAMNT_0013193501 /DNA_START=26 /DNA_END=208 /DNA_ORIENTATION=-